MPILKKISITTTKNKIKSIGRLQIIEKLGGKCIRCGFSDVRALQIDHVFGGGSKHRKNQSDCRFYKEVFEDVAGKFQLLCANCNWIKRHENKECVRNKQINNHTNRIEATMNAVKKIEETYNIKEEGRIII